MKRRTFITLLGGAAAAWPLGARAQQIRRVAIVIPASQNDPEWEPRLAAFGDPSRYKTVAMQLTTESPPAVIVAAGNPLVAQFQSLTKTIPIVFMAVSDPVGGGFVSNIARPGGNL